MLRKARAERAAHGAGGAGGACSRVCRVGFLPQWPPTAWGGGSAWRSFEDFESALLPGQCWSRIPIPVILPRSPAWAWPWARHAAPTSSR
eukprot:280913-Chlamydomonas_euryale.AAC.4